MTKRRSFGPMLLCTAALTLSVGLIPQPAFGQLPWMNTQLQPPKRAPSCCSRR